VRRIRARVSGRVQGVFFRQATRIEADRLGLAGSVRNLPDGQVEVEAEGPSEAIEALLRFLHQGPPLARVTAVEVEELEPVGERPPFRLRTDRD